MINKNSAKHALTATVSVAALLIASATAHAIPYRDDVGDDDTQDAAAEWDGVVRLRFFDYSTGQFFRTCTGSLINPRTVLTAAHCFGDADSEQFDTYSDIVPVIVYGPDTNAVIANFYATGQQRMDNRNGLIAVGDVIFHQDWQGSSQSFPAADIALMALSYPLFSIPTYSMLFSPIPEAVFDDGVHVNMIGYGVSHPASDGSLAILDGKRRAGENMLGLLGSTEDFYQGVIQGPSASDLPSLTQLLYWVDFDQPNRTSSCSRGPGSSSNPTVVDTEITCTDANGPALPGFGTATHFTSVTPGPSIDWFPGDALPNEVGTAPGDSGGPLMAMNLQANPMILGVLSGGFIPGFFTASGQTYGDISYYNPLFTYHQFISENNPYVYASAVEGDGNWSDPNHWVQTMDPNYFIYRDGEIVNGLPDSLEGGTSQSRPIYGTVFDTDIASVDTLDPGNEPGARPTGTPLSGPGSTGFVPHNTRGESGVAFENPARYFEVTLDAAATTTLDMLAVVDKLTIRNNAAALTIAEDSLMVSEINVELFAGHLHNDGYLQSREIVLWGGLLSGNGRTHAYDTTVPFGWGDWGTLFNIAGALNPGDVGDTGEFLFVGDYVQSSGGTLLIEFDGNGNDILKFGLTDAGVSLGGAVGFMPVNGYLPRYGDGFTFLSNDRDRNINILGEFDVVSDLPGVLKPVLSYHSNTVSMRLEAENFHTQASFTNFFQANLGNALDAGRDTDYAALSDLFGPLDLLEGDQLTLALDGLSPFESVQFDRSARIHANSLNDALLRQIGGRFGRASSDLSLALQSAEQHSDGLADTGALSGAKSLFRRTLQSPTGQPEAGARAFGQVGLIQGGAALIDGTERGDVDGHYTLLGFEGSTRSGWSGGVAVGFADSGNRAPDAMGLINSEVETTQYTLFAAWHGERISTVFHANRGDHETRSERVINLGGAQIRSTATYDADSFGAGAAIYYDATPDNARWRITPAASLEYSSFDFDAVTTSAGVASLQISERSADSLIGRAGGAVAYETAGWTPRLYLGLATEMGDDAEIYGAGFTAAPGVNFSAPGSYTLNHLWYEAALSFEREFSNGSVLSLGYESEINRNHVERDITTISYSMRF